jgi:hypothetical protein
MAEFQHLSSIDGMAAGSFTAMNGKKVVFKKEELKTYIDNTLLILESTKDSKGNVVGLPIDLDGHDHKGGAGWIVGFELDEVRGVIKFLVNWTTEGVKRIKENLSRFFSPSIDAENKTILGGSLTNWPATRSQRGQILLRPVELSQSIKELNMGEEQKDILTVLREGFGQIGDFIRGNKTEEKPLFDDGAGDKGKKVELTEAEKQELKDKYLAELSTQNLSVAELLKSPAVVQELARQADALAKERLNMEMRKRRAIEFAAEMTGGSENSPYGLAIPAEDLVSLMLSLTEAQMQAVEKILRTVRLGAIDFSRHGVDGVYPVKPKLPEPIAALARQWVRSGKDIDEFMQVNSEELGDPRQYDLSEFRRKNKE